MNNLAALKDTPDFTLKNLTAEISEAQLFSDISGATHKENAFNLKAEAELKGIKTEETVNSILNNSVPNNKYQIGEGQNKINLGNLLDAELCTKLIDTLIPSLLVLSLKMGAGISVKKSQLQASPRELDAMKPIVQKCLEQIELNINNPFIALGIVMGTIYTTKAAEIGFDAYMGKDSKPANNTVNNEDNGEKRARKPRSDKGQKRN